MLQIITCIRHINSHPSFLLSTLSLVHLYPLYRKLTLYPSSVTSGTFGMAQKMKSITVATCVSGSKGKFIDLAVRLPCINCGQNHQLDVCLKFMKIALKDRINFCFWCLQPMKPQHNAKTCEKRLNCRICSGGHPTAIHGYTPKRKKNAQDY